MSVFTQTAVMCVARPQSADYTPRGAPQAPTFLPSLIIAGFLWYHVKKYAFQVYAYSFQIIKYNIDFNVYLYMKAILRCTFF